MTLPDDPQRADSQAAWWALDAPPSARATATASEPRDVVATRHALRAQQAGESLGHRAQGRGESPLRAFVNRYGWRAYALPILAVVTVVALTTTTRAAHRPAAPVVTNAAAASPSASPSVTVASISAPPTAVGDQALKTDDPGAGANEQVLQSAALPAGGPYTVKGTDSFTVLKGTGPVVGHASGNVRRYSIEVEGGITGIDLAGFAATVQAVLSDKRSWTSATGGSAAALQRVDSGHIDFRVSLTTSMTVRTLCGYDIAVETSCYVPAGQNTSQVNRVVLNDARWVRGDASYIADLSAYREYMINHEVGHAIGHEHAHSCLSDGLAPAMLQQTIGLKTASGQICEANPWPYPPGATDAPGVEAPDTTVNDEFNLQHE